MKELDNLRIALALLIIENENRSINPPNPSPLQKAGRRPHQPPQQIHPQKQAKRKENRARPPSPRASKSKSNEPISLAQNEETIKRLEALVVRWDSLESFDNEKEEGQRERNEETEGNEKAKLLDETLSFLQSLPPTSSLSPPLLQQLHRLLPLLLRFINSLLTSLLSPPLPPLPPLSNFSTSPSQQIKVREKETERTKEDLRIGLEIATLLLPLIQGKGKGEGEKEWEKWEKEIKRTILLIASKGAEEILGEELEEGVLKLLERVWWKGG